MGRATAVRTRCLEQLEGRLMLSTLTVLSTNYLDLTIDTSGYVTNVVDHRAPGVSLLPGVTAPFARVKTGGSWYDSTSATFANNVLHFRFASSPTNYDLAVGVQQAPTKSDYFVFTVNTLTPTPLPDDLQLLNFSTTLGSHVSNFSNIATNDSFAMYVRSFTPAGVATISPVQANIAFPNQMVGASFALGGSDYGVDGSGVLSSLKTMITAEGLLTSSVGGPWASDPSATINQESYVFAFDLSEANVGDWITLAQEGDIGIIMTAGWWASAGHYAPSPTKFPNGLAGMKAVADQIHAAGLKLGFHTFSTSIEAGDPYMTPIPDPRLGKDASFTMTSGITSSATTIYVNQTIAGLQTVWGSNGGNLLQIGNELITYSGYTNNGTQHYFTGLTRGAFGTTAASHSATTVYHVYTDPFFVGDPESTLLDEVASNLAAVINYAGIDMIYLDGIAGLNTYGKMKGVADIIEKLDHPVRIETMNSDAFLWTFTSVLGAADFPFWGEKRFIDGHAAGIPLPGDNPVVFLPQQLGWWGIRSAGPNYDALFPDEMEYLLAKAAGYGASASYIGFSPSPANGRQDDYLAMIENWQTIAVDAGMKARLRVPGDEFHLETLPDGSQHLVQVDYAQQKVTGLADGSQTWTVSNTFGTQFPRMRIEGLYVAGPYNNGTQSLTGSQSDVSASTVTSAANVSASLTWSTSQSRPGQSGSMLFSAANNGTSRTGAWAKAARVFSSSLNISGNDAIGVWVYGDNKGEVLNFQVFNTPGYPSVLSDHFVTVNFNGWRYFELPFREPDVDAYYNYTWPYSFGPYEDVRGTVDRGHVGGINIYYNNLQNGATSNTYISLVKALPVQSIGVVNPSVTIGGATITFPTTLQSGYYIEMNSMSDSKLYNPNGFLVGSITPTGTLPLLVQGGNTVTFNGAPPSGYNARANVTVASYDRQSANWDAATVGHWNFEEASGSTAVDASPYGNNGALVNAPARVAAKNGNGLQFNGTNTSVTIPASDSLNGITGSFTAQLWFKYSGPGPAGKNYWTLLSKNAGGYTYNDPFQLYVGAGDYHLYASVGNGSTGYYLDSGVAINDGRYHQAALVYDDIAKTYTLYLDGSPRATQTVASNWTIARNTSPVTVGYWPAYANYFNGAIDGVQILTRPLSAAEIQNYELAAWWNFDDAGGTSAADAAMHGNTGTLVNGPTWTSGKIDGAVALNGLQQYVAAPDVPALKYFGGELTLSAWVYIDPTETTGGDIISKPWNGVGQYNYSLYLRGDRRVAFEFQNGSPGQITITSPSALSAGGWRHVAATVDTAKVMTLYVDGIAVTSAVHSIANWTPSSGDGNIPLTIGTLYPYGAGWGGNTSYSFDGKIDNVRVYTRTLSAEAIAEQARRLIGFWKFDETSGTTAADASGNENTGMLVNGPTWTTGYSNGAISLDGVNDYVSVPDAPALKYVGNELTLSAWVYIDPTETTGGNLISKPWNGSGQYNYRLVLGANNKVSFRLQETTQITSPSALSTGIWHHIAATVNGSRAMTLYVDGVAVASTVHSITVWTPTAGDANVPLTIGTFRPYGAGWGGYTGYSFDGKLDNVQLYGHALSLDEVKTLATAATVQSVVVNDGNVQRSKVNSITVTFSNVVTIDAGAFEVVKKGAGGGPVTVAVSSMVQNGKTVATLTFSGGLTEYGSLKDGEYQLTIRNDKIHDSYTQAALDGDGNGLPGGDRLFGDDLADAFFRKFGDSDGDRDVDTMDFARFRLSYLKPSSYKWYFDFDGDGDVDTVDLARFRLRYLT